MIFQLIEHKYHRRVRGTTYIYIKVTNERELEINKKMYDEKLCRLCFAERFHRNMKFKANYKCADFLRIHTTQQAHQL